MTTCLTTRRSKNRRIAAEHSADDAVQAVDPLAAVDRFDGQVDGARQAEGQHDVAPKAWAKRDTCEASAPSGTRSRMPGGRITSTTVVASATTRTGTNAGEGFGFARTGSSCSTGRTP